MAFTSKWALFIQVLITAFTVTTASTPYVSNNEPFVIVGEDFELGKTMFTFRVRDSDTNDSIKVTSADSTTSQYVIVILSDDSSNDILVNVTLHKKLDRETFNEMKFVFAATDKSGDMIMIRETVYITDVNDNPPTFKDEPYTLLIKELPCNESTIYSMIAATDPDNGLNGTITYHMEANSQSAASRTTYMKTFSINSHTGHITRNSCLDYETNSYYQFNIMAKDGGPNGGLNTTVFLIIRVMDVQDKPPFFTGIPYRTRINENINHGSTVITVNGRDGDTGISNMVKYTITNDTCGKTLFSMDSKTGIITTTANVDRDVGKIAAHSGVCTIKVQMDEIETNLPQYGSTVASTTVTIDVLDEDDNVPTFNQADYNATVPENTPEDVPITMVDKITVRDADEGNNATMNLTLIDSNGSECNGFMVSQSSIQGFGQVMILVVNSSILDYETRKCIKLKVRATEISNSTHVAEANILINILDRNDNSPVFDNGSYISTLRVPENSLTGTSIGCITATDADTKPEYKTITYSISGGNNRFTVDKSTGTIRTKCTNCMVELDREKRNEYYMTYTATDGRGRSNSISLVVQLLDINDNTPTFNKPLYKASIVENDSRYNVTPIVKLEASDSDEPKTNNSLFEFSIINVTENGFMSNITINKTTGDIYQVSPLDFESVHSASGEITITVRVTDKGKSPLFSTAMVLLQVQDLNDNDPIFNQTVYGADVPENETSSANHSTHVANITASDLDGTERNRKLYYIITDGASDRFRIDASTGQVSIQRNARLDRELVPSYNVTIIAIDQGSPQRTGTTILQINVTDVNDENPMFVKDQYTKSIKENTTALGTILATCDASDPDVDSDLEYTISDIVAYDEYHVSVNRSLVENYFSIHPGNGSVYVNATTDRETAETIVLTILVCDKAAFQPKPQNDSATLRITLTDVNDNYPMFLVPTYKLNVRENAINGTILDTIKATDKDSNRTVTYQIQNGSPPTKSFTIEKSTGVLSKTGPLDRELNSRVVLQVIATDNGVPPLYSTVDVHIEILDFNDNTPVFGSFNRTLDLLENIANNSEVITVFATDADEGPNANITYFMDKNEHFAINHTTGLITVRKSPNREITSQFKLHIIVKDNPTDTKEQKSSGTTITVVIDDENDNSPKFTKREYVDSVVEDAEIGKAVLTVTATDADKPSTNNSYITFSIAKGFKSIFFKIDAHAGTISVNSSLVDKVGTYRLKIVAYDQGSPRLNGTTFVNITVLDKNLHNPVIGNVPRSPLHTIKVYECAPIGTVIHTFNYTDKDQYVNAEASFNISQIQDVISGHFNMTTDGQLIVIGKLDVAVKPDYTFQIQATDHGTPPLSSEKITISVILIDVNDHLPSFKLPQEVWSVPENTTDIRYIGTVVAVDKDRNSIPCYEIKRSNWTDHFNISETGGEIFIIKELDHEITTRVTFTVKVTDCSLSQSVEKACGKQAQQQIANILEQVNDTIEVTIHVTDIDDSPPVFKNRYLATGMRRNTEPDTELQLMLRNQSYISDADSPQNGVLSWTFSNHGNITISPELQSKVYINSGAKPCDDNIKHIFCVTKNGTIVNNKFFSEDISGYVILTVKVTDNGGHDTANITIYLISDSQVLTMTIRSSKQMVSQIQDELLSQLSGILGKYNAVFDSLQDHKENGQVYPQSSDLSFHLVEQTSQAVVSGSDAINLVDQQAHTDEMIALQNTYHVIKVSQRSIADRDTGESSQRIKFILVAVSVAEAVIISIVAYVALVTRNKYQRKLKAAIINPPDMELNELDQTKAAIPGSNIYSKQHNPLLNVQVNQIQDDLDSKSTASYEDLNLDENMVDDLETVYDTMEEKEVTLDMYNDDTFHPVSSEDLLGATLHIHAMRKSKECLDQLEDVDETSDKHDEVPAFINDAYNDDYESTEI